MLLTLRYFSNLYSGKRPDFYESNIFTNKLGEFNWISIASPNISRDFENINRLKDLQKLPSFSSAWRSFLENHLFKVKIDLRFKDNLTPNTYVFSLVVGDKFANIYFIGNQIVGRGYSTFRIEHGEKVRIKSNCIVRSKTGLSGAIEELIKLVKTPTYEDVL